MNIVEVDKTTLENIRGHLRMTDTFYVHYIWHEDDKVVTFKGLAPDAEGEVIAFTGNSYHVTLDTEIYGHIELDETIFKAFNSIMKTCGEKERHHE